MAKKILSAVLTLFSQMLFFPQSAMLTHTSAGVECAKRECFKAEAVYMLFASALTER